MVTWFVIGAVFLGGAGLYAYLAMKERGEQDALKSAFNTNVDTLLGQIHSMTDTLKSRVVHKVQPASDFESQLREAMKENP